MHELGHSLGLYHGYNGWPEPTERNREPNFLSVMNYSYQLTGIPRWQEVDGSPEPYSVFDYSRFAPGTGAGQIPDLVETALVEQADANRVPAGYGLVYWKDKTADHSVVDGCGTVDWNLVNGIEGGTVSAEVNGEIAGETLTSHDDWSHLNFRGGNIGALGKLGLPPWTEVSPEDDEIDGATYPPVDGRPRFDELGAATVEESPEYGAMAEVTVTATATDPDGPAPSVRIVSVSSEDEITEDDWSLGEDPLTVSVMWDTDSATAPRIYWIWVTATDSDGRTVTTKVKLVVPAPEDDAEPPTIEGWQAMPGELWPPNHKLVQIGLLATIRDNVDHPPAAVFSIRSSEPDDIPGVTDGVTTGDIRVTLADGSVITSTPEGVVGPLDWWQVSKIELRAERDETLPGRTYTLEVVATDGQGNSTSATTTVIALHNPPVGPPEEPPATPENDPPGEDQPAPDGAPDDSPDEDPGAVGGAPPADDSGSEAVGGAAEAGAESVGGDANEPTPAGDDGDAGDEPAPAGENPQPPAQETPQGIDPLPGEGSNPVDEPQEPGQDDGKDPPQGQVNGELQDG
jgi:hypothetical protein